MSAGHFVQTVSYFRGVKPTTQHLRRQQAHATADWTSREDFLNHLAIVINRDVEVLTVKRNLPRRATQFAWTLDANRSYGRHFDRLRMFARDSFLTRGRIVSRSRFRSAHRFV